MCTFITKEKSIEFFFRFSVTVVHVHFRSTIAFTIIIGNHNDEKLTMYLENIIVIIRGYLNSCLLLATLNESQHYVCHADNNIITLRKIIVCVTWAVEGS